MLLLDKALERQRGQLPVLIREVLGQRRLIIASNRGPLEHYLEGGKLKAKRGSGGVVTALTAVADYAPVTWMASAMTEGDRLAAEMADSRWDTSRIHGRNLTVRFVASPECVYDSYYNVFSNPVLWFLQHQLIDLIDSEHLDGEVLSAWQNGYEPVNRAFANSIILEILKTGSAPVVMLHDYHLYLVARYVRTRLPKAILQHFVHIPWPAPGYWQILPPSLRTAIVEGLCANDIVGFQTRRSAKNFLSSCQAFLKGAEVDFARAQVVYKSHVTRACVYPISIDNARVRKTARSTATLQYVDKLLGLCGQRTIVRVDRVDPSKNIVRGFEAFDLLLTQHPELVGQVKFLAFLVPSRNGIREYQDYLHKALKLIRGINEKYAVGDWRPIELFYENNYEQALAGMQLYDVLLVNPVQDGMNLVVKEGALINQKDGVVVLSERAGAYEQLQAGVLRIDPLDVAATADTLYRALTLPAQERKQRASLLRQLVEAYDITSWLYDQFHDLRVLMALRAVPAYQLSDAVERKASFRLA